MEKSHNVKNALLPLIDRSDFLLVFLFGSFAKECSTNESDVDVAIMFEKVPDFYQVSDLRDQLTSHLEREVDILILNTASPIMRRQVLKYGQLVKKNEKVYNDFFVRTLNEYSDLKYLRREAEESIMSGRLYA